MVREWVECSLRPEVRGRVVFLEDYDIALAAELVQGVDLWINTPRRPWEACGTSGMKLLVNGGLNLSERDGWWAEAYVPEAGWALGDRQEHEDDPGWDAHEADELYRLLEQEVVPAFYRRDARGIPVDWVARIRASMARLAPRFSSNRMVREYAERCYLPATNSYRGRAANRGALAAQVEDWYTALRNQWSDVHFGNLYVQQETAQYVIHVQVYLGRLDPDSVEVELYANALDRDGGPVRIAMRKGATVAGAFGGWIYEATITKDRPADHYTPRVIPRHGNAFVPLEAPEIVWFR